MRVNKAGQKFIIDAPEMASRFVGKMFTADEVTPTSVHFYHEGAWCNIARKHTIRKLGLMAFYAHHDKEEK